MNPFNAEDYRQHEAEVARADREYQRGAARRTNDLVRVLGEFRLSGRLVEVGKLVLVASTDVDRLCAAGLAERAE